MDYKPARFLCLWNSPGKNTGVGGHFLLQKIFLTQGLNPGLPHCRRILYCQDTREAQFGYWKPKSHLSKWEWPSAVPVPINMNFFSRGLLSRQMVWLFITRISPKTQDPSTLYEKCPLFKLHGSMNPLFQIHTLLFPPIMCWLYCMWSLLLLFNPLVMSDCLWLHGLQHTKPPCPSPSPEVCLSSCSLHRWCHPTLSSSDTLFSFCPQSVPASGTFPMSQLFTSDDQNTGASASVFPMYIRGWFPLRMTSLISSLSKRLSGVFSSTTVWRHQFFGALPSLWSSSHNRTWLHGKTIALTVQTFVSRVMSLLFNRLSRFIIAFLPRSNCLLISWLQSPSAVILESLENIQLKA